MTKSGVKSYLKEHLPLMLVGLNSILLQLDLKKISVIVVVYLNGMVNQLLFNVTIKMEILKTTS